MPKPPLPDDVQAMLAKPNPAVITSLRADGAPVSVATWYLWVDGQVLVSMDPGRKRIEHLRADPRTSITVLDDADWYTHVSLQGRVVRWEDDHDLAVIDRIAQHYIGQPYRVRDRVRVSAWIDVDRWHGWGAHQASDVPQSSARQHEHHDDGG